MNSKRTQKVSKKLILGEQTLSLMRIKWLEVLLSDEIVIEELLPLLKRHSFTQKRELNQRIVDYIVQDRITKNLQFLVVELET